ncbi:MAG: hypothetical protein R3342_13140 [Lutibacter sp.]|uniref:hypothetical protein n=1 Tax=Lutibacter sp. TaxID=1925666 RepID=UPI00299E830D|nr:hypothetical protein [Lutibacter sp.]MDX1830478.1 hypothetical protein [Lutibacter sp.]
MKIFPEKDYSIELNKDSSLAISELKNRTLSKEQFVTNWNNQSFIGKVETNEFKIKLSKKLIGEFCVLNGKLENGKGTLKIRTSRIIKIIFIAIVLFAISGIITAIFRTDLELIFHLVMTIFFMRFIFIELGFRLVSKMGMNKLTEIIGIDKLTKTLCNDR